MKTVTKNGWDVSSLLVAIQTKQNPAHRYVAQTLGLKIEVDTAPIAARVHSTGLHLSNGSGADLN